MNYIFNIIRQMKDERVSKIIKYRYLDSKKKEWNFIAKKLNISAQTAINLHERGMSMLRRKINSKQFSDSI